MRTLVQLSDLHFDHVDQALLAPLVRCVTALQPHLIVVSGDLTQRARSAQFQAARAFLDQLPSPQLIVPGNHDISLHNLFARFFQPLTKYRRYITEDLQPAFTDDEIAVLGINTARSLTIKDGRINQEQIAAIRNHFSALPQHLVRIVVTHHPFDLPEEHAHEDLVGRASLAMPALRACKTDLLLSGHLHTSHADTTEEADDRRESPRDYAALVVQAGTATSTRGRGETNSFNVIRIDHGHITVERYGWAPERGEFLPAESESFKRIEDGWRRVIV